MFIKKCYTLLLRFLRCVIGDNFTKVFDARLRFHRKLDLKNPKTLADKVSWLSINDKSPLFSRCTDKYEVRRYVAEKGLEDILIPLVGGPWEHTEEIDFSMLPDKFILKATHGCKMNYPVYDKADMDLDECKARVQRWLGTTYGTYSMEIHYESIPHRVYAEKLIEGTENLIDYKFHCMNGEPQFVLVCSERKADGDKRMRVTLDLFDMDWKPIYQIQGNDHRIPGQGLIRKPALFDEMVDIARRLSSDFRFVRVDLYEENGSIRFGELTFTPSCGVFSSFSEQFIEEMGSKLTI